jgi:transcriptional regulatory protein LevR
MITKEKTQMENQNQNVNQQPQGWKDVNITPDMPLAAMVQFFNVLNQRLCTIEDNLKVEMPNGEKLSITQIYALQAEAEQKAQQEQEQKGE